MIAIRALGVVLAMAAAAGSLAAQDGRLTTTFGVRSRVETWDWFDAGPEGRYAFSGSILRGGITWSDARWSARIEAAAPVLLRLPEDASLAPPAGALGLGASYYAANDGERDVAGLFAKEAWVQLGGGRGHRLRLGRTEFSDGAETTPASATLATVKAQRIAQRLLGPFGWSHAGRSFDGASYAWTGSSLNFAFLAARPTRGAFDAAGWDELTINLGYGALTAAGARGEARLFALYYDDRRKLPMSDNRPAAIRLADSAGAEVITLGGHLLRELSTGVGAVDLLAWGAAQWGAWGADDHRSYAVALEAGIQPEVLSAVRPWLRAGVFRARGDDDPSDGRHETFFPVLPTPRIYARMPFFTTMNLEEAFGSVTLRPGRVVVRSDLRVLRLAEQADLWYAGGGAFEAESFGYAARPAAARGLATLADVSVEWRPSRTVGITLFGARAAGGEGIEAIYGAAATGTFGYVEVELRR